MYFFFCSEIVRFQASQEETHTSVECILLLDGSELPRELFDFPVRAVHVSSAVMRKLAGLQSVDSTVAVALLRFPTTFHCIDDDDDDERAPDCEHWFPSPHRLLALDGIQVFSSIIPKLISKYLLCVIIPHFKL